MTKNLKTIDLDLHFSVLSIVEEEPGITQRELAKKLGVSDAYVSQVLNGKFNFTLKKLIELGLAIGKIPKIKFVPQAAVLKKPKQINKVTKKKNACQKKSKPTKQDVAK